MDGHGVESTHGPSPTLIGRARIVLRACARFILIRAPLTWTHPALK